MDTLCGIHPPFGGGAWHVGGAEGWAAELDASKYLLVFTSLRSTRFALWQGRGSEERKCVQRTHPSCASSHVGIHVMIRPWHHQCITSGMEPAACMQA
jgi:hypothetical protein